MITQFYNKFIVEGNLLQTISNLLFLCVMAITLICFLKSMAYNKRTTVVALKDVLFVDILTAFCFLYNSNTNLFKVDMHKRIQIILIVVTALVSLVCLVGQLMKKPLENGTLIVMDSEGAHQKVEGKEYKKVFNKRKMRGFIGMLIRDVVMIISLLCINPIKSLFDTIFVKLSGTTVDGAHFAAISVYSIILVGSIVVVAIINWFLDKCDTL